MTTEPDWEPCPVGTIKDVADRQMDAARVTTLSRRAVVVGAVSAGTLLLWTQRPRPQTLTCRQVCDQGVMYVQGQLSPDLAAAIATHCKTCGPCKKHIATLRQTTTA
ncbi:MAG: hypothetical protein ABGZ53_26760 [Fuerstiella sp.]